LNLRSGVSTPGDCFIQDVIITAVIAEEAQTAGRHELVTITSVLPHEVNPGHQDWDWCLVDSVQGISVRDFEHFNQLLDEANGPWINITFTTPCGWSSIASRRG
jgi:hypothetical protein